mgnify:CR=1 FL=1
MEKINSGEFLCSVNVSEAYSLNGVSARAILELVVHYNIKTGKYFFYCNGKLLSFLDMRIRYLLSDENSLTIKNAKKGLLRNKKLEQLLK